MKTVKLITTIVAMICLIMMIGCSDDPTDPNPNPNPNPNPDPDPDPGVVVDEQVVGDWLFVGATVDGRPASLAEVLHWEDDSVMAAFGITEDGSYAYVEVDENIELTFYSEGTVSTTRDKIEISTSDMNYSGTWQRSRDLLTLTSTVDGAKVALTAQCFDSAEGVSALAQ